MLVQNLRMRQAPQKYKQPRTVANLDLIYMEIAVYGPTATASTSYLNLPAVRGIVWIMSDDGANDSDGNWNSDISGHDRSSSRPRPGFDSSRD